MSQRSRRLLPAALYRCCWPSLAAAQVTAIRAGRLIDPETGTAASSQVILVENGRFTAVGANVAVPAGAEVIDLSSLTVLPGLVDAHNHLALTYKDEPESNVYYFISLTGHTNRQRYDRTVSSLRNAWQNKVTITFSTDADYYVPGKRAREGVADPLSAAVVVDK